MKLKYVVLEHPVNPHASADVQYERLLNVKGVVMVDMDGFYLSDRVWHIYCDHLPTGMRLIKDCEKAIDKAPKGDFFDSELMGKEFQANETRLRELGRQGVRIYFA